MNIVRIILLWVLLSVPAWAQIQLEPAEVPRDTIGTATLLDSIPEGAVIKGSWYCETAHLEPVGIATKVHVAGRPGKHRIQFNGYWQLLGEEITVVDTSGNERTFIPFLGSGQLNHVQEFTVVTGDDPDPPDLPVTREDVLAWVELVPLDVRTEEITNPITGETMTRQQAIGQTFLNIGKAGVQIASVDGMDLLLSTALVSALGDSAAKWRPLADKLDGALQALKDNDVSAVEYAGAFIIIGETLTGE